jgi:signal transduction histidine kinase
LSSLTRGRRAWPRTCAVPVDADAAMHAHEDFLALSRELRTPLGDSGLREDGRKGALADASKVQVLAAIERHALAQTQLIDDLFDASRAAGAASVLQDVDLAAVVRSVVEALRPAIAARRSC